MSDPMTPEEFAEFKAGTIAEGTAGPWMLRLLATIDERDREIADLRRGWEELRAELDAAYARIGDG